MATFSRTARILIVIAALAGAGVALAHDRWGASRHHHRHHSHWHFGLSAGIGFGGYWPYGGYWAPGAVLVVPAGRADDPWRVEAQAAPPPMAPDPVFVARSGAQDPMRAETDWRECTHLAFGQAPARADAQVFHRSVLGCMDQRGYALQ